MTERFARNQLKELDNYMQLLQSDYEHWKSTLGEEWIENKVHEILNEMQYYKDFLSQIDKKK
jgi:hypothetical protein